MYEKADHLFTQKLKDKKKSSNTILRTGILHEIFESFIFFQLSRSFSGNTGGAIKA